MTATRIPAVGDTPEGVGDPMTLCAKCQAEHNAWYDYKPLRPQGWSGRPVALVTSGGAGKRRQDFTFEYNRAEYLDTIRRQQQLIRDSCQRNHQPEQEQTA